MSAPEPMSALEFESVVRVAHAVAGELEALLKRPPGELDRLLATVPAGSGAKAAAAFVNAAATALGLEPR